MEVLVTGSAGFIGSSLVMRLLERGDTVVGIDNHNDYYDPRLKEARLAQFVNHKSYTHARVDICDDLAISDIFTNFKPRRVVNMAAQAGVRHSLEAPLTYAHSNLLGFAHILEACRRHQVEHLVYASSSSVYGANTSLPFSVAQRVDHPLNLYAATKKANELMAHAYSHLFEIPSTGLRFFTVYGPWGRPDMALFKFTEAMLEGRPIDLYNYGNHRRDFTYIDDIVEAVVRVIDQPAVADSNWSGISPAAGSSQAPWRVYNIGNSQPVELMSYVSALEKALGINALVNHLPLQSGDLEETFADVEDLVQDFGYRPTTRVEAGVASFVDWYLAYRS